MNIFNVVYLTEAKVFFKGLDEKSRDEIVFNIDKTKVKNDKELFKKLEGEIWEFRTLFNTKQCRLFAFWDKTDKTDTLVLATHGIVKKTGKTPKKEIQRAEKIGQFYFAQKNKQDGK